LIIVKTGDQPLPGLTDTSVPRRLGPKRANKIRKLFNLTKEDDVRKHVIGRVIPAKKEGKKPTVKRPKIQRLVTPTVLQRKRSRISHKIARLEASRQAAKEYAELVSQRKKERTDKKKEQRRSSVSA
jgi:small subunit ribosomal protein S6e